MYSDTKSVLIQLKQLDYILGIITDCDEDVANGILNKHNLADYFDIKIISSIVKIYKPNPLIFKEALKRAKCKPNETIYVGDSEIDIKGAKDIGIVTVIINRNEKENQEFGINPDFKIYNLKELLKILN